jgi:phosphate starvation-inducible protein PhoH
MVVDGDQKQSDIGVNNGLSYFIGLIEKTSSNNIRLIEFKRQHVIRSEVVAEVLSLFEGS